MEVKGKILAKKGDNKAFKLDDGNWYNLNDNVIPYLEKMNKSDEVVVTYEKKGVSRYVSKLTSASTAVEIKTETISTTGYVCNVCGKEMKDDKYKTCFVCNKKGLKPKEEVKTEVKKEYKSYDNPEKTAQIQRGNALNAASSAAVGRCFLNENGVEDPDKAIQWIKIVADSLLEWLRAE
jgi:hypothetical protein